MPMYDTLVDRIYKIYSNAESMQPMLGGDKLGFLSLTVLLMVYNPLSLTPLIKSANPGMAPAILTSITGIEQTTIWYVFTLKTELYTLLQKIWIRTSS